MPRFVAVGELMLDVDVAGGPGHSSRIRVAAGGSAANAGVWAAACGAEVTVVGRVGDDAAGRMLSAALGEHGVEARLAVDPDLPTGTIVTLEDGVRADRGANARLAPADLPAPLDADVVLVSGYQLLQPGSSEVARAALERSLARWVAVDAASPALLDAERFAAATAGANVLLANEEEARRLTGQPAERAVRELGARYDVACVKLGPAGAVAVRHGRLERAAPASLAEARAGTGDAFAAGLLVALARGAPLAEALAEGCRCGALAATRRSHWPSRERPVLN